jgi:hypothetical protein
MPVSLTSIVFAAILTSVVAERAMRASQQLASMAIAADDPARVCLRCRKLDLRHQER